MGRATKVLKPANVENSGAGSGLGCWEGWSEQVTFELRLEKSAK